MNYDPGGVRRHKSTGNFLVHHLISIGQPNSRSWFLPLKGRFTAQAHCTTTCSRVNDYAFPSKGFIPPGHQ
uniref:Uncharacterized protein n=1 Tax=Magallana gigas TaxID=29159 RepID=K1QUF1_MAGGI